MAMDKIRDNVYVGSWQDAQHGNLVAHGITAVLDMAWDSHHIPHVHKEFRYVKINLEDADWNKQYMKDLGVYTLKEMLRNGETVLVHCVSGHSRSVYVIARILAEWEDISIEEAFSVIKKKHPKSVWGRLGEENDMGN